MYQHMNDIFLQNIFAQLAKLYSGKSFTKYHLLNSFKAMDLIKIQYMTHLNRDMKEDQRFLLMINNSNQIYMNTGSNSRSSKKVDCIHQYLEFELMNILPKNYHVKQEQFIQSHTASDKKKCDLVIYKDNEPFIILPVKYTMTTYNKNKNNYWENMCGEILCLKTKFIALEKPLHIIPINIISNQIPNRKGSDSIISNIETITYNKSYKIYERLLKMKCGWDNIDKVIPMCDDIISYIINVEHLCNIGEKYDKCPKVLGFSDDTPHRPLGEIISKYLN